MDLLKFVASYSFQFWMKSSDNYDAEFLGNNNDLIKTGFSLPNV